jgi:hypothetical protein
MEGFFPIFFGTNSWYNGENDANMSNYSNQYIFDLTSILVQNVSIRQLRITQGFLSFYYD